MKEEIDWKKELLESKKFNNQFSKNILENGARNLYGLHIPQMEENQRLDLPDHENIISRPFPDHKKEEYGVS